MQYLLSEEEMQKVLSDRASLQELLKILPNKGKLQKLCTKIADEWETWTGWKNDLEPTPWGCILSANYEHYCDECPVRNICPYEDKAWSK